MKKLLLIIISVFFSGFAVIKAATYNMANGTITITCPGPHTFYDPQGTSNYNNSQDYTLTVYPSTAGQCVRVSFTSFTTESSLDYLRIYDGPNSGSPLLGTFSGSTLPPNITSTGGPLTFVWHTDGSVVYAGWVASLNCVACPPPPAYYTMSTGTQTLTCPPTYSLFYDSGGPGAGNYSNSENYTKTFTAPAGYCLRFSFNSAFQTESSLDVLRAYNGPNTGSPLMGTWSNVTGPGVLTSSGNSITFNFTSDGSVVYAGWEATITCVPACSGMPNGGAGTVTGGGCLSTASVQLSSFGSTTGCGITYQWQSGSSATGPWSNVSGATSSTLVVPTSTNTYYHLNVTCGGNTATGTSVLASTGTVATCALSTYSASSIAYSWDTFAGTTCPNTDDVIYTSISMIGFQFCYGGNAYWGGYISANGAFILDAVPCFPNVWSNQNAAAGIGTGWSITGPAPSQVSGSNTLPQNAINAPWHDINPGIGGTIRYATLGVSPNRRFVLSYENVPMYSCGTSSPSIYYSAQIKLYETSNNIEIHVQKKGVCPGWNNGQAIMGLTSFDGTIYRPPVNATAHNATAAAPYNQWTMNNTAYRWTSPCAVAGGPCVVLPINFKNFYGERVEKVNRLFWETSEEKNIKTFIVERSSDAENFTEIAKVLPTNQPSKYNYDDKFSVPGTLNYYRITAIENNGERKTTHVVPLGANASEIAVSGLYPNPVDGNSFNMIVDSKISTELTILIYDSFGRLVSSTNKFVNAGPANITVDVNDLSSGVYSVEITNTNKEVVSKQKLVKVNKSGF